MFNNASVATARRSKHIFCRIFGHQPGRRWVQLDTSTFMEWSHCKRCGICLRLGPDHSWKVVP